MAYENAADAPHQLIISALEQRPHLWHHRERDNKTKEHENRHDDEHGTPSKPFTYIPADDSGRQDACQKT